MKTQKMFVSLFFAFLLTSISSTAWAEITGPTSLSFGNVSTEVLGWQWAAANSSDASMVGGGGAGKASFSDLNVTRLSDHSSSEILRIVATGERLQTVTLTRGNLTIVLENAFITSYSINGISDKKEPTSEIFSLSFSTIKFQIDGSGFCWDQAANASCPY